MWVVPLILAIVPLPSLSQGMRTVDLLRILACGVIIGISFVQIIEALKSRAARPQ